MTELQNFRVDVNDQGTLTATLDVPNRPVNVFADHVIEELHQVVQDIQQKAASGAVKFVVFRSGKPTGFLAGADIHRLQAIKTEQEADWILQQGQQLFNTIEQLSVPTLAVIHGACMGGGLEFAMACTYRLVVNSPSTKLALPEVKLGLLPGWGGTQRLPKKVGLSESLPMMLEGKALSAERAVELGLADGLISSPDAQQEIDQFVEQHRAGGSESKKDRTWMKWALDETTPGRMAVIHEARKRIEKQARHYPALVQILEAVEAGLSSKTVTDTGLAAERAGFNKLLMGSVAPNLISLFLLQEKAKKTSTWVADAEGAKVKKIAVIGAGTMGAGIAQQAAARGYDVILQDIKQEFVDRGMNSSKGLFEKAASKGIITQGEAEAGFARMTPRVDWGPSEDVDLMIEAVLEKPEVKEAIFRKADEMLPPRAVLASNTSALPINAMANVTSRPQNVAGLHFFNPVHLMPLVEVVRAPESSDETIATLVGVAKKLGKIPVVVKQSPGFLVNRILFPYLDEAARLVAEGYDIEEIDREAKKFGMPVGPVELLDVVGIDVALDVAKTLSPLSQQETPALDVFQALVNVGQLGQKSGKGFFVWEKLKKVGPADLPALPSQPQTPALSDWNVGDETLSPIQQRLALSMLNEARKCLAEGVVSEPWMADLGMVLGTGFAPFRGGPMKTIEAWGEENVTERLKLLTSTLGKRFEPSVA